MSKWSWLPLLPLLLFPAAASRAAEMNRCTAPDGTVSFSDQPCPDDSVSETVKYGGQPRISDEPLTLPGPGDRGDGVTADGGEEADGEAPQPPAEDPRLESLRRLNFLLGELVNSVTQAGIDCAVANGNLQRWLRDSAPEAERLWPAWRSVRAGEEPEPSEDLLALGELIQSQVRSLESEVLTRLTALCWDHPELGDTIDAVRERISSG